MNLCSRAARIAACSAGLAFLWLQHATAQDLHVIVSNGVKPVLEELQQGLEHAAGHPLKYEFGTTQSLKQKIAAGEPFDVAVLTTEAVNDLANSGKIAPASRADVGRAGIGIGARAGAPKPDIHTPDALKRALQSSKGIAYAGDGASRPAIEKMVEHLGIAGDLKDKTILEQGSVRSAERVKDGKVDYVITLVPEILPVPGIELVGPLPAELQSYVSFRAGVSANSKNAEAGKALVEYLAGRKAAAVFKAKGLEAH